MGTFRQALSRNFPRHRRILGSSRQLLTWISNHHSVWVFQSKCLGKCRKLLWNSSLVLVSQHRTASSFGHWNCSIFSFRLYRHQIMGFLEDSPSAFDFHHLHDLGVLIAATQGVPLSAPDSSPVSVSHRAVFIRLESLKVRTGDMANCNCDPRQQCRACRLPRLCASTRNHQGHGSIGDYC